ncbi:Hexokinase-1 [Ceratocystis fimbriata CBS 114723]|uniref:Phosphotransferase n=1 Tax=Ceratocystis fimbriata CBS 114723 TaxID=1035309 RepID=A0A2C5X289_9PEZI|nr:Hexokinase-1 [Ceratocystis fimbriata CBS 114723]
MTALHKDFLAAILRSLRRGKSFLQAVMDFFCSSKSSTTASAATPDASLNPAGSRHSRQPQPKRSSSSSTTMGETLPEFGAATAIAAAAAAPPQRPVQDFLDDVDRLFLDGTTESELLTIAAGFRSQFMQALESGTINMLPSYSYRLPSGAEAGRYLAVDVGGSNLRIALIELLGCGCSRTTPIDGVAASAAAAPGGDVTRILAMKSFPVSDSVRGLVGMAFFEWMAAHIAETLRETGLAPESTPALNNGPSALASMTPLPLSLAWSFPIDQTSLGDGRLLDMGKGLKAVNGLMGQNIGDVIKKACAAHGLSVELRTILNDSTACLLSQSYTHLTTRMGLILGTGTNIAAFLPVGAVARHKFGHRPPAWWDAAAQVIVNTEVSMVGKGLLPATKWDARLKAAHEKPDFQPLEQMASGMYLGEICRLVLLDAISETGLLGGLVPESLKQGYSLKTETLACIESDPSPTLETSIALWKSQHPSPYGYEPTAADLGAIRRIASAIARRSSSLIATSVYALWDLRSSLSREHATSFAPGDPRRAQLEAEADLGETAVAFNGSVIEKYPGYLQRCSAVLGGLVDAARRAKTDGREALQEEKRAVTLVMAQESSLFGAAIALAIEEQ